MVVLNSIEELDSSTMVILSSVVAQRFVVATSDFAMAQLVIFVVEVSALKVMVFVLELMVSVLNSSIGWAVVILDLVSANFRASIVADYRSSIIELNLFVAEGSELDIEL